MKRKMIAIIMVGILVLVLFSTMAYSSETSPLKERYNLYFLTYPSGCKVTINYLGNKEDKTTSRFPFCLIGFCKFDLVEGTYFSWEVKKSGYTLQRGNAIIKNNMARFILLKVEQ